MIREALLFTTYRDSYVIILIMRIVEFMFLKRLTKVLSVRFTNLISFDKKI